MRPAFLVPGTSAASTTSDAQAGRPGRPFRACASSSAVSSAAPGLTTGVRKGLPIEAPPRPLSPSRRRHARRAPAGPAHSSTDGTQSKRTPVDHPSANSCKQEGQPFRLPQPHPVDDLTSPITADIGRSLQSCSYSPSRSSQSSPCQVRCCCSSFSPKCRKRHLGDMGSEKATSQMRTYIQPAGSHV